MAALGSLIRRNNRRYGGYMVHLAMLLIGAGAVGSQVYQQQTQASLAPGQSVTLAGYTVTAHGIQTTNRPGREGHRGRAERQRQREIRPAKQFFDNFPQQPSTKVGLRSTPFEDLYVVLAGWEGDGPTAKVSLAVFVNPLVSWIWTGGVLLLFGTLVTLWPRRSFRVARDGAQRARSCGRDGRDLRVVAALPGLIALTLLPALARADALDEGVRRVALQLQCPVCEGENVADSPSGLAGDMRAVIRTKITAGEPDQQILDEFVASYGDGILTEPPKRGISLGVWLGPVIGVVLGAVLVGMLLSTWRRMPGPPCAAPAGRGLARSRRGRRSSTVSAKSSDGERASDVLPTILGIILVAAAAAFALVPFARGARADSLTAEAESLIALSCIARYSSSNSIISSANSRPKTSSSSRASCWRRLAKHCATSAAASVSWTPRSNARSPRPAPPSPPRGSGRRPRRPRSGHALVNAGAGAAFLSARLRLPEMPMGQRAAVSVAHFSRRC